jgi:hypothetical protein
MPFELLLESFSSEGPVNSASRQRSGQRGSGFLLRPDARLHVVGYRTQLGPDAFLRGGRSHSRDCAAMPAKNSTSECFRVVTLTASRHARSRLIDALAAEEK